MNKFLVVLLVAVFSFSNFAYSVDEKEEAKEYIEKANPIIMNVDTAYRQVSLKVLPLEKGAKKMQGYIDSLSALKPPELMKRQHDMMLLAFKQLRMGYLLLSKGHRSIAIKLVRKSGDLLKLAVKDIKDFVKKEGLVKIDQD